MTAPLITPPPAGNPITADLLRQMAQTAAWAIGPPMIQLVGGYGQTFASSSTWAPIYFSQSSPTNIPGFNPQAPSGAARWYPQTPGWYAAQGQANLYNGTATANYTPLGLRIDKNGGTGAIKGGAALTPSTMPTSAPGTGTPVLAAVNTPVCAVNMAVGDWLELGIVQGSGNTQTLYQAVMNVWFLHA